MKAEIFKWIYAYAVALIGDLLDYLLFFIFDIPVIGDIFDIITIVLLIPVIGKYAFVGLFELVPVIGDLAPSHTIAVALAQTDMLGWRKK